MPMALGLGLGLPYMAGPSGPSPALDLNFAAMAASQALDSRITYSGASLATLVNAAGLIAYKPHNLLTWAGDYSNAVWSAILGSTSTASTVTIGTGASAEVRQIKSISTASLTFTASVKIATSSGTAKFRIKNTHGGVVDNYSSDLTATTTPQWFSLTVNNANNAGDGTQTVGIVNASDASSNGVTFLVSGAQLNIGPLQPYYPTTSAAYFGPRFTYDPITLNPLGLLIEEQRTNLLVWSEALDNAVWVKSGCTITADATVAPDGNSTADLVVVTGAPGSGNVQSSAPSSTSGTVTFSVYAKAGSRSIFNLTPFNGSPNTDFNLSTVSKTDNGGAVGSITSVGNGWYRCSCTITLGAPSTQRSFIWSADGIYFWGAQLEAGAFATSYIPTTSASVTRAADSATMTGANFSSWFNAAQGTVIVEGASAASSGYALLAGISAAADYSGNNAIELFLGGGTSHDRLNISVSSVDLCNITSATSMSAGSMKRIAGGWTTSGQAICQNGGAVATHGSIAGLPASLAQMYIGSRNTALSNNGPIKRLRYYNTALTNAQLQALTA